MRIPISINGQERPSYRDRWPRFNSYPSRPFPPDSDSVTTSGREEKAVRDSRPSVDSDEPPAKTRKSAPYMSEVARTETSKTNRCEESPPRGGKEDWRDRFVRLKADYENHKRNAAKEREQLVGLGKEEVLDDIFPLVEHMERAIKAAGDTREPTAMLQGLELVYRELLGMLEKHGVERVRTVGEPFDPSIHEAVAVTPDSEYLEETVIEEVRAGFIKGDKLLRPASVVVAQ